MIDSHAHLYFDRFDDDRLAAVGRAHDAGVEEIINIGIDLETSRQAIALAREHRGMYASAGIHPTSAVDDPEREVNALRALVGAERNAVVAIGEIGLDFYWKEIPPDAQRPKLLLQLELARHLALPVIFHCRDALAELFELLERETSLPAGVFHCFSGGAQDAERALGLGFHVSFAGNVTYPKAKELQEAAKVVPLDKLLLETDSPFLAPQKRRGKRNEPSFLPLTCDFLAELKGVEPEELATIATQTTRRLFELPGGNG